MSVVVQHRRDSQTNIDAATLAAGEIGHDTTNNELRHGDGATLGGTALENKNRRTILSPSQITSNQNDYAPTGHARAALMRINADAARNITGLASGAADRALTLFNNGSYPITLKDADAASSAVNRFSFGFDLTLGPNQRVGLVYIAGATNRWVLRSAPSFVGFTLTPSQITSNQNDYAPADLQYAGKLRLDADAARNVTGISGGWRDRMLVLQNVGSFNITLKNDDAASNAANRFDLGGDIVLVPKGTATLLYDATTSRWTKLSSAVDGLQAGNNLSDLTAKYTALDNLSVHGADVASASTVNLETATGFLVDITGTTTITAITLSEGHRRLCRFTGALTLTHGSSLVLPGAQDIVTAAGDYAEFVGYAAGVVRCAAFIRGNSRPLVAGQATIASGSTTDLGSKREQAITVSGTTTITSFGSSAATGEIKAVYFSGALTLTHNGTSLILPGAIDIATAAGDCLIARHEGSGNWRVLSYQRVNGKPLETAQSTIASGSTTDLGSVLSKSIVVSGTTTITSFGSSAPTGDVKFVYFSGALKLTHNGTSLILPGAIDITTAAGDCLIARHEGSGNWRVLHFMHAMADVAIQTPINNQTASYTLAITDAGRTVEMNNASANNLTVPPNSSVAFPIGAYINWFQQGAGRTTLVAGSGVTIRSRNGLLSGGQYAGGTLYKRATDEWVAFGDLASS